MMIELEQSFYNRAGRRNDKSARGHEMALGLVRIRLVRFAQKMPSSVALTSQNCLGFRFF